MPSPTTPILDTFTRADENPLTSANWAISLNDGHKIVSNQCVQVVPTAYDGSTWKAAMASSNVEVYCTLGTVPAIDTLIQLILRMANQTDFAGNYMHVNIANTSNTSWDLTLYANNGSDHLLSTVSLGAAYVPGDQIWLKSVGNVHEVYFNGVLKSSITDTNNYVPTGNYLAMLFNANSNVGITNFGGGVVTTPVSGRRMIGVIYAQG